MGQQPASNGLTGVLLDRCFLRLLFVRQLALVFIRSFLVMQAVGIHSFQWIRIFRFRLTRGIGDHFRSDGFQVSNAIVGQVDSFVELDRLRWHDLLIVGTVRRRVTHETQRRLIRLAQKTDEGLLVAFAFGHVFGEDIGTHTMAPSMAILALDDQFVGQIFLCAQRAGR